MNRPQFLNLAITTAAQAAGSLLLGPGAGKLAAELAINLGAELGGVAAEHAYQRWLGSKGLLNGDLARALGRALRSTLDPDTFESDYKETRHYRSLQRADPEAARQCLHALEQLSQDLALFFQTPLSVFQATLAEQDLMPTAILYGEDERVQQVLNQRLADYLHGHDPDLICFLQKRMDLARLRYLFVEELKAQTPEGERAWRAFQRLLLESLQEGLRSVSNEVRRTHEDVAAVQSTLDEVSKATGRLQHWAEALDKGQASAEGELTRDLLASLAGTIAGEHQELAEDHDRILKAIEEGFGAIISMGETSTKTAPLASEPKKVFICYKQHSEPDHSLAHSLYSKLAAQGHSVFIDASLRSGTHWLDAIDTQIRESDYLVVLLSAASADSEMVRGEVQRASQYRKQQGHPKTLPVRLAYEGMLPYSLAAFLDPLQYVVWHDDADDERVFRKVLDAIEGRLEKQEPIQVQTATEQLTISEDGRVITDNEILHRPLPEFDPRILVDLEVPCGIVRLQSKFHIARKGDAELRREVLSPGSLTYIRAARQTGKSSLLIRGIHHARQHELAAAFVDCQFVPEEHLADLDSYLRCLAELIAQALGLGGVDEDWQSPLAAPIKMSNFLETKVLQPATAPVVLAMDEVDRVYGTPLRNDFFGMVRAWYNRMQWDEVWGKLTIAMVISTEPYLLIDDPYQSPFNVGTKIELEDFNEGQVADLNARHGGPLATGQVRDMSRFLGGHPYLTRRALYAIVAEGVTWDELVSRSTGVRSCFSDHLRRYLWLLSDKPDLSRAMKRVIKSQTCGDELMAHRLHAAGLIRHNGSDYVCRCPLYEAFFAKHL